MVPINYCFWQAPSGGAKLTHTDFWNPKPFMRAPQPVCGLASPSCESAKGMHGRESVNLIVCYAFLFPMGD